MDKIFVLDKKYFVMDKINLSWTSLILSWTKNILYRHMDRAKDAVKANCIYSPELLTTKHEFNDSLKKWSCSPSLVG